jgi:hypothetical protein
MQPHDPRLVNDCATSSTLIATDPHSWPQGPISGEISIAPMTTAVELTFNSMDATKIEKTRTVALAPGKKYPTYPPSHYDQILLVCLKDCV